MTTNETFNILVDKRIKQEADALYNSMGMSLSTAINLFLTQSVLQGKLPLGEIIAESAYAGSVANSTSVSDEATVCEKAVIDITTEEIYAVRDTQVILDSLVGIASSEPLSLEQARKERLARQ